MNNKVNSSCVKICLKSGNYELACFIALKACADSVYDRGEKGVGGDVITDYAYDMVKGTLSRHQWAGYLSSLKQQGKYKALDEGWGIVYFGKSED